MTVFHFADGIAAECDFETLRKNQKISVTFHDINPVWSPDGIYFRYPDENGLHLLIYNSTCHQTVDQLCQPWVQLLYDTDDSIVKDQNSPYWSWNHIHACTCLRYNVSLNSNILSSTYR